MMNKTQIKVLSVSWITYAVFYFLRVNFSIAIPGIIAEFEITKTALGLGASTFFAMYAIGQFVSGQLADNIGPKKVVAIGLVFSIIINAVIPFWGGIVLLVTVLWGLNGIFQSMGWSPNVKIASAWFPINQKGRASGILGTSYIVGGALSWVLAGFLAQWGWRFVFYGPVIIALVVVVFWLIFCKENPEAAEEKTNLKETVFAVLNNRRIWLAGFGLFGLNIVRYGFLTWAPTYFFEVQQADITLATFKALVFPIAGAFGAIITGWLSDSLFKHNRTLVGFILCILLAVSLVIFINTTNWIIGLILLSIIGFCTFGPHMMLVTELPMILGSSKNTASICGFIDGIGYIGAALTGILSGFLADSFGWDFPFYFWVLGAVIAGIFILLSHQKQAKLGALEYRRKIHARVD